MEWAQLQKRTTKLIMILQFFNRNEKRLTFSHVSVTSDGASTTRLWDGTSWWQANDANPWFEFSLALQFEQSDIIVQGLTVVIVVNVSGGYAQCLGTRTSISIQVHTFPSWINRYHKQISKQIKLTGLSSHGLLRERRLHHRNERYCYLNVITQFNNISIANN